MERLTPFSQVGSSAESVCPLVPLPRTHGREGKWLGEVLLEEEGAWFAVVQVYNLGTFILGYVFLVVGDSRRVIRF